MTEAIEHQPRLGYASAEQLAEFMGQEAAQLDRIGRSDEDNIRLAEKTLKIILSVFRDPQLANAAAEDGDAQRYFCHVADGNWENAEQAELAKESDEEEIGVLINLDTIARLLDHERSILLPEKRRLLTKFITAREVALGKQ